MPKVKDLPRGVSLKGKKLRSPKGVIGYYASKGENIVFLSKVAHTDDMPEEGKRDETRLYPQVIAKDDDLLEWDIIEDESTFVNCGDLTSHNWTFNVKD